jgi:hypothetical protein
MTSALPSMSGGRPPGIPRSPPYSWRKKGRASSEAAIFIVGGNNGNNGSPNNDNKAPELSSRIAPTSQQRAEPVPWKHQLSPGGTDPHSPNGGFGSHQTGRTLFPRPPFAERGSLGSARWKSEQQMEGTTSAPSSPPKGPPRGRKNTESSILSMPPPSDPATGRRDQAEEAAVLILAKQAQMARTMGAQTPNADAAPHPHISLPNSVPTGSPSAPTVQISVRLPARYDGQRPV